MALTMPPSSDAILDLKLFSGRMARRLRCTKGSIRERTTMSPSGTTYDVYLVGGGLMYGIQAAIPRTRVALYYFVYLVYPRF